MGDSHCQLTHDRDQDSGPNAQANGNVLFHVEDGGMLNAAANSDQHNAQGAALSPITPIRCRQRESRDSVSVATPLSVEPPRSPNARACNSKRFEEVVGLGSGLDVSPRTPAHGVFDPFAPGPDHQLLAPVCKKFVKKSQRTVVRRLDFDDTSECSTSKSGDCEDAAILLEKAILESMYETLLEAIVSKQTEEFSAENHSLKSEVTHTPTSSPPLTGVSKTCPATPMKAVVCKSMSIDPGLCRKLDF